jgi:hypothetical protein
MNERHSNAEKVPTLFMVVLSDDSMNYSAIRKSSYGALISCTIDVFILV